MSASVNHASPILHHGILSARAPNWLPLPIVAEQAAAEAEPVVVDEHDNFPKGTVETWYPEQGVGFVKTDRGIVAKFSKNLVSFVGHKNQPSYLKAGARVGYDLGVTSDGPRICTLKIY